jgi:rhomboid protease GluP
MKENSLKSQKKTRYSQNINDSKLINKGIFLDKNYRKEDPRKEKFHKFIKDLICPKFKLNSFTFLIIINNTIIFIITIIYSGIEKDSFLQPKANTLILFGALSGKKLKENIILNLYRWIMNSFLHGNFIHLFYNIIGIFTFGSYTENLLKTKYYTLIYLLSGFIGSLFSVLIDSESISVGASISVYGIFGSYFGNCIIKWKEFDRKFGHIGKFFMTYVLFIFVIISLLLQLPICGGDIQINFWGHLGGFLSGILLTVTIIKPKIERDSFICNYKIWYAFAFSFLGSFFIVGILVFYLF